MFQYVILFCNFFMIVFGNNISYLSNNVTNSKYIKLPESNLINKNPTINPFIGFACNEYYKKDNMNYLITAAQYPNFGYNTNSNYKCGYTKKYVEILKYKNNSYVDKMLIGENNNEYTTAVGNKGCDNVVSCGIDNKLNILYYIASNMYGCNPSYDSDSSLVRINLTDFSFMDRTVFNDFPNKEKFSKYSYYDYKYLNAVSTASLIDGDSLWIGFGTSFGGIWKLNIATTPVMLLQQFQKTYMVKNEKDTMMGQQNEYEDYFREIKRSFINKERQEIYFIEDSGYNDAKVLIINYSKPLNENTTTLKTLDGLSYISDIKLDDVDKNIYIISGSLNSELYKLDYNFNRQRLNTNCDIDFLKFPPEWGVITNIQLDLKTGYMYAIPSTRYNYYGIVRINMKNIIIDVDTFVEFKQIIKNGDYSYFQPLQNSNISYINFDTGKLLLLGNSNSQHSFIIEYDLYGCSMGRGNVNNICEICIPGKYSNSVGGICLDCNPGYANKDYESISCNKCEKGKFTTGKHTVNCINCPAGFFIDLEGHNQCKYCPKGKYSITSTSVSENNCLECGNGKFSDVGKTICLFCEIGKWSKNRIECVGCSSGKFSNSMGLTNDNECKLCPIGKFNDINGLSSELDCKNCEKGKIGIVDGAKSNTSCIQCESGKYKQTNIICNECPGGWISNNKENKCDICNIGKWAFDKKMCMGCPKGKYSFVTGLIDGKECISCEIGKFQPYTGKQRENACINCEKGKIGIIEGASSNRSCVLCDDGKYKNTLNNCIHCPDGWISTSMREKCTICQIGKYTNSYKNYCDNCPTGKYNDKVGISTINNCIECPKGTWTSDIGNIHITLCKGCKKGLYGNELGLTYAGSCKKCPAGKFNDNDGLSNINDCKECSTGSHSDSGSIICKGCGVGKYSLLTGSSECLDCEGGKYTNKTSSYLCNTCPLNSEQNKYKTGCICSQNSYNTFTNNDNLNCIACNNTFSCNVNTNIKTININQHYWRSSDLSTKIYKCKNRFACKGGIINISSDDLCNEGFKGPLCNVCEKGWAKDDGVCLKCPEEIGRTLSLTIIIPIVSVIIIIFLIKTANPANNKKEEVNGVVKIFMNYAQVFSLASSFQINWPSLIRYLFERAKEFSSPRVSFYSSDCAIGWSYYEKLLVYLILPIFYIFSVTIIIALISLCYCKKRQKKIKKLKSTKSELEIKKYKEKKPSCLTFFIAWEKTAIVVGTFLSWPTIVTKTLEVLNCENIDDTYYLINDYSIICYDNKHYTYLIIAYIALILYGLGIPLLGFKLLYNHRYRLYDMHNRYDGSTPLSFLFLGYREKRWYYEFIIMGKKAGLILLSVFLKNYPRYQIIAASLLIQISFFLHVFLRPYDIITSYGLICNRLESVSLLSLVMTLSTGLFFGTIDSGYKLGTFENILIILLILCNGGISLYFFVYFVKLGFKSSKNHLQEHLNDDFKKNKIPFILKCCNISHKNIQALKYWSHNIDNENYGISLKNQMEKEIFANYFTEKKKKLSVLNNKLDNIKKRRLSVKLDKLRSEIQVMEKQRCWQTIQNNRLYNTLKNITMINKTKLSDEEREDIEEIYKFYINHGINYNTKMNDLYMKDLKGMIQSHHNIEMKNEIIRQESKHISENTSEEEIVEVTNVVDIII